MTSAGGLVTGNWTVRVQAKMLPYNNKQSFSLIVTADGLVIPPAKGSLPIPVSPAILQQCQATSTGECRSY